MEAISVKNLSVAYDDNLIIDHMTLSIPRGEINIIIGGNGCGKSTLLKSIARVIKPKAGEILINGKNIKEQKEKHIATQISFLPQEPVCPSGITIKELVAYGRYPHQKMIGGLSAHDKDIINWALRETGLKDLADREIENLSGGQRQRAWLAMSLAQETDIIMLDEPTTYLDMSYQLEVLQVLEKLNQEKGITIVMVLHEINHAFRFASNIIGLKDGKVICQGNPKEIITKESLKEIYGIDVSLQLSQNKKYPVCVDYELIRGRHEK